ncbi:MAG: methyltransferase domain-containing protein [Candidatus Azambacteria bacterium]|nr:methyltransferase domain-containing protein [Candidatus Azambacteria bacterium]
MVYQDKNKTYIDPEAYDKRGESSLLERYVLDLWQPFLKKIIGDLSAGKVVIDLGCGTGEYTQSAIFAKKIYAVDISEPMLKVCSEKLGNFSQVEIINSSVVDINLPSADLVITIGVWEYINPDILFHKIKEMTYQGSKVIVVFPNRYNALNFIRSIACDKKVAIKPRFIKKLFDADFRIIDSKSFGAVFWFPKKWQFLAKPIWKLGDWLWRPFQKFLPIGINVYYLFEKK